MTPVRALSATVLIAAISLASPLPAAAQSGAASAVAVAPSGGGPAWSSLSPAQRTILEPLARDWASLDASGKAKWLELATRFPQMPADEQRRVQERMIEWARMTPAERGRARLAFQETKRLSREEKQAHWEAYQALSPEERKALAARNQAQTERPHAPAAAARPLDEALPKQNLAAASAPAQRPKPVAPTVVQARPGATTTLMTQPPTPPSHQRPGEPKIAAQPGQVDRATLLPKSGPQSGAASTAATRASAPATRASTAAPQASAPAPQASAPRQP